MACKEEIARLSNWLVLSPGSSTAVVGGRAGLEYKMHATVHSRRIQASSWKSACRLINSGATWVGDLGVKSRLNRFRGHIKHMFGDWAVTDDQAREDNVIDGDPDVEDEHFEFQGASSMVAPCDMGVNVNVNAAAHGGQLEDEACEFSFAGVAEVANEVQHDSRKQEPDENNDSYVGEWQEYPFPPDPHAIDSTASIFIAGILHIMSNVTKSMGKAMIMFSEIIKQLTNVYRALSKKEYRSQLMQTCFDRYPHSLNKSKFKDFSCHVHEDRWGTPVIVISLVCLV